MAHVYAEKEQKTIEAIHQIVITCSKQYCEQGVLTCTAQSVKEQLYISRSLASLYLNQRRKDHQDHLKTGLFFRSSDDRDRFINAFFKDRV